MSGRHHHRAASGRVRRATPEEIEQARKDRRNETAAVLWAFTILFFIGYLVLLWSHSR